MGIKAVSVRIITYVGVVVAQVNVGEDVLAYVKVVLVLVGVHFE